MAFTGTPAVKIVSDNLVRISPGVGPFGLNGSTGTIGLFESTLSPEVRLPAAFRPRAYSGADDQIVSLQDSVQVTFLTADPAASFVQVFKSGSDATDLEIAFVGPGDTGDIEIYIRFH